MFHPHRAIGIGERLTHALRKARSFSKGNARSAASVLDRIAHLHIFSTTWLFAIGVLALFACWQLSQPVQAMSFGQTSTAAPIVASDEEVRLLAATTWAEARSEGEDGMRAVAHVIVNRIGPRFGENLATVIYTPMQFSAWNPGDPNRPLAQNPDRYARGGESLETWEAAQRIAREVLERRSVDPTGGALFYHTRAVRPHWSGYGVGKKTIGAHIFYADVPDAGVRQTPRMRTGPMSSHTTVAAAQPQRLGPRAGRVRGVIQHAPLPDETTPPPVLYSGDAPAPQTPDVAAADPAPVAVNLSADVANAI